MKTKLIFFALALLAIVARAQSISPDVLASAGAITNAQGTSLQWTLGEPLVKTLTGNNAQITQGFHQPDYEITAVTPSGMEEPDAVVYPNPTVDQVYYQFPNTRQNVAVALVDLSGRVLERQMTISPGQTLTFEMEKLASGQYLLQAQSLNGQFLHTFKIIKNK